MTRVYKIIKKHFTDGTLLAILLLFIAALISILLNKVIHLYFLEDFTVYERAARAFLKGQDLKLEYPIFSLICFIVPALFSNNSSQYGWVFFIQNFLILAVFICISFDFFEKTLDKKESRISKLFLLVSLFFFLPLLLSRYDIWVGLIVISSVYLFMYKTDKLHLVSYILIIFAGFIKIYPFLFLPIFLYTDFELLQSNKFRSVLFSVIAFFTFCLLINLLKYEDTIYFLTYHYSRGIQIESTYSSLLLNLKSIGVIDHLKIGFDHGSFGVSGDAANKLKIISTPLLILIEGLIYILYIKSCSPFKKDRFINFLSLTLLAFLITSKVLSTQFFIWLFPFIIVSLILLKGTSRHLLVLFFLLVFITFVLFPLSFGLVISGSIKTNILLLIRNIILIILFMELLRHSIRKTM